MKVLQAGFKFILVLLGFLRVRSCGKPKLLRKQKEVYE